MNFYELLSDINNIDVLMSKIAIEKNGIAILTNKTENESLKKRIEEKEQKLVSLQSELDETIEKIFEFLPSESHANFNEILMALKTPVLSDDNLLPTDLIRAVPNASNHGFNEKVYQQILPFTKLAYSIEKNGIPEEHAYKLTVLCGDLKTAIQFLLSKPESTIDDPQFLHASCLFQLPSDSRWQVDTWRQIFKKDVRNQAFLTIFPEATNIEEKLSESGKKFIPRIPFAELRKVYSMLSYRNAHKNPEAAILFRKNGFSEEDFNKYIALSPRDSDQIPNEILRSDEIPGLKPGYFIKKLDPADPLCAILGKKTGCCQMIGGQGEVCTIHGITSELGGFYGLFSGNPAEPTTAEIVAQCWVWRSKNDVLVFDSIESSKDVKNRMIGNLPWDIFSSIMFSSLAQRLVNEPSFNINSVNVGIFGETPEIMGLFNASNEIPIDHDGYRDSKEQRNVCNLKNRQLIDEFNQLTILLNNHLREPNEQSLKDVVGFLDLLEPQHAVFLLTQFYLFNKSMQVVDEHSLNEIIKHYSRHVIEKSHGAESNIVQLLSGITSIDSSLRAAEYVLQLYQAGLEPSFNFRIPEIPRLYAQIQPEYNTALDILLKQSKLTEAKALLALNPDVREGNPILAVFGPLYGHASPRKLSSEQVEFIDYLISQGANINAQSMVIGNLTSPLDALILTGNDELVDKFIGWGASDEYSCAIECCVIAKNKTLLEKFHHLNWSASKGDPVGIAVRERWYDIVDELISMGANITNSAAVFNCLINGPIELVRKFIDMGIDLNRYDLWDNALKTRRFDVLDLLLDKDIKKQRFVMDPVWIPRADLGYQFVCKAKTPLFIAISENQFSFARKLLAKNPELGIIKLTEKDYGVLEHDKSDMETNHVLRACVQHNSQEGYEFAIELIAAGAPLKQLNLDQEVNGVKLGAILLKTAQGLNSAMAIEKLQKQLEPEPKKRMRYPLASSSALGASTSGHSEIHDKGPQSKRRMKKS